MGGFFPTLSNEGAGAEDFESGLVGLERVGVSFTGEFEDAEEGFGREGIDSRHMGWWVLNKVGVIWVHRRCGVGRMWKDAAGLDAG